MLLGIPKDRAVVARSSDEKLPVRAERSGIDGATVRPQHGTLYACGDIPQPRRRVIGDSRDAEAVG